MSTFEFVSVLLSIVISLAIAHLLTGVAQALKAKKVRVHWVLVGWWLFVLMLCVDYWFSVWRLREAPIWTLGFVLTWLALAAITYITAWLVVPDNDAEGTMDFVAHSEANRRKYLGGLLAWVIGGRWSMATRRRWSWPTSWRPCSPACSLSGLSGSTGSCRSASSRRPMRGLPITP